MVRLEIYDKHRKGRCVGTGYMLVVWLDGRRTGRSIRLPELECRRMLGACNALYVLRIVTL
jgi:hypothetical protein